MAKKSKTQKAKGNRSKQSKGGAGTRILGIISSKACHGMRKHRECGRKGLELTIKRNKYGCLSNILVSLV